MPEKRYTKVEEEVIQILDRMESERPATNRPNLRLVEPPDSRRRPTSRRSFRPSRLLSNLTTSRPWIWIVSAIALAFAAILVRDSSDNLALGLAIAAILMFFAPLAVGRRGSSASRPEALGGDVRTWRGRDISLAPPDNDSPVDRLSRWFNDRRRGGPRR